MLLKADTFASDRFTKSDGLFTSVKTTDWADAVWKFGSAAIWTSA
jgi:hypothetical protein